MEKREGIKLGVDGRKKEKKDNELDLENFNSKSPEVRFIKIIDLVGIINEITKSEWEIVKIVIDDRFK
jgi:hypothetical protein